MLPWRAVSFKFGLISRAYVRIIYEKTKGKSLWEHHMTYIGKQNVQAKKGLLKIK